MSWNRYTINLVNDSAPDVRQAFAQMGAEEDRWCTSQDNLLKLCDVYW